jgi:hypothetical protein
MTNSLGNLAALTTDQIVAAMRHQLDRMQRQPTLTAGFPPDPDSTLNQNSPDTQTLTFQLL